jgi:diguanylate cyclase (GGDEF)-like protein
MELSTTEFYRLDPLTGSQNFLSFVETLDRMSAQEKRPQFSILYTDLNNFHKLNETKGHAYGDTVVRWLGIVLQEECNSPIYRIGGDDFAVILTNGIHAEHEELLNRIYTRLNREGEQLGIPSPPTKIALIHFEGENAFSINDVIFHLWETIHDVKKNKEGTISIFWTQNLVKSTTELDKRDQDDIIHLWEVLRYIANNAVTTIIGMGQELDTAQKDSFLDSISGLPNLRAALLKMEKAIKDASTANQTFAILMIDGDNIRRYNSISYAAGDEMIQNMGKVLSEHLRPEDFLARWRTGDEFMVILPNTSGEGARIVGERFCSAIREASKKWKFPTSISIGIAIYPKHGEHINALVDAAEMANKRAKDEGKDRVILAG